MIRPITDPTVFYAAGGVIVAYILYMIVRRRRGERPGTSHRESEL